MWNREKRKREESVGKSTELVQKQNNTHICYIHERTYSNEVISLIIMPLYIVFIRRITQEILFKCENTTYYLNKSFYCIRNWFYPLVGAPRNCHICLSNANCNSGRTLHAHDRPRVGVYTTAIRGPVHRFSEQVAKSGRIVAPRPTTLVASASRMHARVLELARGRDRTRGDRGDICGKPHILPVNRRPSALHTDFRRRRKLGNAPNSPGFSGSRDSSTLITLFLVTPVLFVSFSFLSFFFSLSSVFSRIPWRYTKEWHSRHDNGLACWKMLCHIKTATMTSSCFTCNTIMIF